MPDTIIYLDRIKSVTSQHNVLDTITYGGIMVASTRENVMTKLAAHGTEIGTIYGLTSAKRYMSDGKVLKNIGFGWKLYATIKAGVNPPEAFAAASKRQAEKLALAPVYVAYFNKLHSMAGLSKRWKLHAAVSMMPEDCDGVWSEA